MPVTREDVIWGFRMILGRDPESEEAIRAHLGLRDRSALREALLDSAEIRKAHAELDERVDFLTTTVAGLARAERTFALSAAAD